jgi:hypothetical protein
MKGQVIDSGQVIGTYRRPQQRKRRRSYRTKSRIQNESGFSFISDGGRIIIK